MIHDINMNKRSNQIQTFQIFLRTSSVTLFLCYSISYTILESFTNFFLLIFLTSRNPYSKLSKQLHKRLSDHSLKNLYKHKKKYNLYPLHYIIH